MKIRLVMIISLLMLLIFPQEAFSAEAGTITITVTIAEVEIIEATVEFRPQTIRPGLRYLRCYIELPALFRVEDIDTNTVAITEVNGVALEPSLKTVGPSRIGDFDRDGITDLEVRFDIRMITPLLKSGENSLTVSGSLFDGRKFKGTGTASVIKKR